MLHSCEPALCNHVIPMKIQFIYKFKKENTNMYAYWSKYSIYLHLFGLINTYQVILKLLFSSITDVKST